MRRYSLHFIIIGAILILVGPATSRAEAQDTVGGHVGVLFPLVNHGNGTTVDITDDFTIAFPVGITVRKTPTFAFDLEFVPNIQNAPLAVNLTVHPGVLFGFAEGWNAGVRVAFEIDQAAWGCTPLVNDALFPGGASSTVLCEGGV